MMHLSMVRKIDYGEPKSTRMTLTIADRSRVYPFIILKDVLVKVDKFVFSVDFVILDMGEDLETPHLLGIPFLDTE